MKSIHLLCNTICINSASLEGFVGNHWDCTHCFCDDEVITCRRHCLLRIYQVPSPKKNNTFQLKFSLTNQKLHTELDDNKWEKNCKEEERQRYVKILFCQIRFLLPKRPIKVIGGKARDITNDTNT